MTFKLSQSETFEWPVKWKVPGDGKLVEVTFTGVFRRMNNEQLKLLLGDGREIEAKHDDEVVREALIGWRHVTDDEGQAAPFNDANLDKLLAVVGARPAIVTAFIDAMTGALARKNS